MPDSFEDWLAIFAGIVMFLFGSGGVAAFYKSRRDVKNGVRQENRADVDSLNARAVAIVENQFNYLVKPLQERVESLHKDVGRLELEVQSHQHLYQMAVSHIRTLYSWIARHMPHSLEDNPDLTVPEPPNELLKDVRL